MHEFAQNPKVNNNVLFDDRIEFSRESIINCDCKQQYSEENPLVQID